MITQKLRHLQSWNFYSSFTIHGALVWTTEKTVEILVPVLFHILSKTLCFFSVIWNKVSKMFLTVSITFSLECTQIWRNLLNDEVSYKKISFHFSTYIFLKNHLPFSIYTHVWNKNFVFRSFVNFSFQFLSYQLRSSQPLWKIFISRSEINLT